MSATRDVMVSVPSKEVLSKHIKRATSSTALWSESLDTPGIVPRHLLRSASASFPIFEVIQRILRRLGLNGTIGDLEKVLALVGFYNAVKPAYNCLKDFFWWACTAQITISESDPVAKEVLAWMGAEVKYNSHARRAMLVTGNSIDVEDSFTKFSLQLQQRGPTRVQNRIEEKPTCLPSIGTRMFW
jgi:chaperone BCS1